MNFKSQALEVQLFLYISELDEVFLFAMADLMVFQLGSICTVCFEYHIHCHASESDMSDPFEIECRRFTSNPSLFEGHLNRYVELFMVETFDSFPIKLEELRFHFLLFQSVTVAMCCAIRAVS